MKQLNIGKSINKKKIRRMTKIIERNVAEILVIAIFAIIFLFGITFILRKYFFKR